MSLVANDCFGQQQLPTIRSSSPTLDIEFGDSYFAKDGWHLNPDAKPDVFRIGSKLPYETKTVTFTSDIESISFDVEAGNEYDFVVIWNDETACQIQIQTAPDPVLWQRHLFLPILIGLAFAIAVIGWCPWPSRSPRPLLYLGFIAPILFWLSTMIAASRIDGYSHVHNVISELGLLGSPTELLASCAFVLNGLLCGLFTIGFYKASKQLQISIIPALLTLSVPLTKIWAGFFPLGNEFHAMLGPFPLLLNLGALLAFVLWPKQPYLKSLRLQSILSFAIMMLILLIFAGKFSQTYEGLVQRFWYFGWTLWFTSLSAFFLWSGRLQIEPESVDSISEKPIAI